MNSAIKRIDQHICKQRALISITSSYQVSNYHSMHYPKVHLTWREKYAVKLPHPMPHGNFVRAKVRTSMNRSLDVSPTKKSNAKFIRRGQNSIEFGHSNVRKKRKLNFSKHFPHRLPFLFSAFSLKGSKLNLNASIKIRRFRSCFTFLFISSVTIISDCQGSSYQLLLNEQRT